MADVCPFEESEYSYMWCNVHWLRWICGSGLLIMCAILVLAGCSKRKETPQQEEVYSNRAHDKGYMASLLTNRQQQAQEGYARLAVSMKMTQCVTRVRATLPADTTAEALKKALTADPEWISLDEQSKKLSAAATATLQQAHQLIRQRMQEEMRAQKAIAQGKAKAIDGAGAPKTVDKK